MRIKLLEPVGISLLRLHSRPRMTTYPFPSPLLSEYKTPPGKQATPCPHPLFTHTLQSSAMAAARCTSTRK